MRIVLLGDSHLARVRRDLAVLGGDVRNAAQGGASVLDLPAQVIEATVDEDDLVVVSVGTNDAAPSKQVPVAEFAQALAGCLQSVAARGWVYVAPPGVDESRLTGPGDRTNAVLDDYRAAAVLACNEGHGRGRRHRDGDLRGRPRRGGRRQPTCWSGDPDPTASSATEAWTRPTVVAGSTAASPSTSGAASATLSSPDAAGLGRRRPRRHAPCA